MVSDRKREANRKNAQRSTGPKSGQGKTKSSANALKHGAFATKHYLFGEDEALYKSIRDEQRRLFPARTYIEEALVNELVNQLWNLRRFELAERYYLSEFQREVTNEAAASLTTDDKEFLRQDPSQMDSTDPAIIAKFEKIKKEVSRKDRFYVDAFIFDESLRVQRIASLKRFALQTVLSLEKELQRRFCGP